MSAACRNCGAALSGRYCSQCGQAAEVHVPSVKEIIHEVLEGLTHSDSRLWNTLKCLWLKPGELTLEFIAGRRVAYLPPFRLYLILSVLYFFLSSVTHQQLVVMELPNGDHSVQTSPKNFQCKDINSLTKFGRPDWNARLVRACNLARSDNGASLNHVVEGIVPKVMFVFLPLIALLHMLMYWRPRHRYAEHLLFFLHIHAFFFSVATLSLLTDVATGAWTAAKPAGDVVGLLLFVAVLLYSVVALHRVFGHSWLNTLLKGVLLFFVYLIVMALGIAAVSIYAILQL
jgi:hypothetical protein